MNLIFTAKDGKDYRISWKHIHEGRRHTTHCYITPRGEDGKWNFSAATVGTARCNPMDVFDKETARRISLERVLASWTRPSRFAAWESYWRRKVAA